LLWCPMLTISLLVAALLAAPSPSPTVPARAPAHLLVVTVTKGYHHDTVTDLERLVTEVGAETGAFDVDYARTDADLSEKASAAGLARYQGVVFASTTGDLPLPDRDALLAWIAAGHAFIGIHAATDTFHGFPAYLDMIGGEFEHHGPQAKVHVLVQDADHPATRGLEPAFDVFDEVYQFKRFDPDRVHVLLALERNPETGAPGSFPLAWTRETGRGRVFYTALGHRPDVIAAPWYRAHLRGGILWALGQS